MGGQSVAGGSRVSVPCAGFLDSRLPVAELAKSSDNSERTEFLANSATPKVILDAPLLIAGRLRAHDQHSTGSRQCGNAGREAIQQLRVRVERDVHDTG